ncbi:MAG TPA: (2Fe-2S) ferredoxin domain-containing protein [Armatimonadota bacterium]|jgi:NADP-reducing hydrogenase subunit HndB
MAMIKDKEQLAELRDSLKASLQEKRTAGARVLIGMGTCGIAAGARDVMDAVRAELTVREIPADVVSVGCIGICQMEPIVDIEQGGRTRVTYPNVTPEMVPRLIEEHFDKGRIVEEWAVARLDSNGLA